MSFNMKTIVTTNSHKTSLQTSFELFTLFRSSFNMKTIVTTNSHPLKQVDANVELFTFVFYMSFNMKTIVDKQVDANFELISFVF